MIRSLNGEISALNENSVILTVNNIGYEIHTNTNRHQFIVGEIVFFYTYLVVRENILDLYGFTEKDELTYFELLLDVPKIGPKSALQILCQADTGLLHSSIIQNDPDQLHKLSGIGKKTALNIINYLSNKIDNLPLSNNTTSNNIVQLSQNQIDAIDALITLGYDASEARSYVTKLNNTEDTKTLVQAVLKQIPIP
jgi:Holliday junction DNA helicase RuvA